MWERCGKSSARGVPWGPDEWQKRSDNHNPPPSDPGFLRSLNLLVEGSTPSRLTNTSPSLSIAYSDGPGTALHSNRHSSLLVEGSTSREATDVVQLGSSARNSRGRGEALAANGPARPGPRSIGSSTCSQPVPWDHPVSEWDLRDSRRFSREIGPPFRAVWQCLHSTTMAPSNIAIPQANSMSWPSVGVNSIRPACSTARGA